MGIIKSKKERIFICLKETERSFEKALNMAMNSSIIKFEIDESGYSKYEKQFPRNESSLKIEFVKMNIAMGMNGHSLEYEFLAWLEKESDN